MPQLKPENISKIIIKTTNGKDVLYEDNIEISEFVGKIDSYLESYPKIKITKNTKCIIRILTQGIYEIINNETIDYLTESNSLNSKRAVNGALFQGYTQYNALRINALPQRMCGRAFSV